MSEHTWQPISDSDVEGQVRRSAGESTHESTGQSAAPAGEHPCYVLIHNDDTTPFEYVIATLIDVFMLSEEMADHIAWTAHSKGQAVVIVRPRREAAKLAGVAQQRARVAGYPLVFSVE